MLPSFRTKAFRANDFLCGLRVWIAAFSFSIGLTSGTFANDPNPVAKVPTRDPAMSAAFARASASLDAFFKTWRSPPTGAQRFTVKIGLIDTAQPPGYSLVRPDDPAKSVVEWFWITDLRTDGAGFSGRLANDPDELHNVAYGQTIHFNRENIGDWMYRQDGKIIGNATACPALAHASVEERRAMKEQYGLVCD